MDKIKNLNDMLRRAIYGAEVRSAIIESFAVIDKRIKWLIVVSVSQSIAIIILGVQLFLS